MFKIYNNSFNLCILFHLITQKPAKIKPGGTENLIQIFLSLLKGVSSIQDTERKA